MADRSGKRIPRGEAFRRRIPALGYYLIVTDTDKTECNYITGFRQTIPAAMRDRLVIKVHKSSTGSLVDAAERLASQIPQYAEPWIMLDRDLVPNFDQILEAAIKRGIHVAWSNPCCEIWLGAYLGAMQQYEGSPACCNGFAYKYFEKVEQEYRKNDEEIYSKLCRFGNEESAIKIAKARYESMSATEITKPSLMNPATTVYMLIEEINAKE
ncbi:MAG: RloB family protein [Cloacibacillus sp.]